MEPDRLDLTPIDPAADPARWERMVAAILARAEPELARRAAAAGVLSLVARWYRPALAAAAAIGVVAVGSLLYDGGDTDATTGYTDALDVPAPMNRLLQLDRELTVNDLVIALEEDLP